METVRVGLVHFHPEMTDTKEDTKLIDETEEVNVSAVVLDRQCPVESETWAVTEAVLVPFQ